jgi:stage II sporulation protein M
MSVALWLTFGIGLLSVLLAYFYVDSRLPAIVLPPDKLQDAVKTIRVLLIEDNGSGISALTLFGHNLRAEIVIMGMGVFSFGVLGMLMYAGNFALIGGVLAATRLVGLSRWMVFLTGILPHGIVELPSVILASGAILYMGARLVTPIEDRTIGETMIITFAEVMKVFVAICIPLLLIAGLIEANITPRMLLAFLGHALEPGS